MGYKLFDDWGMTGYSVIIDQYGDFIDEKRAKSILISYSQEVLGRGINLSEQIN